MSAAQRFGLQHSQIPQFTGACSCSGRHAPVKNSRFAGKNSFLLQAPRRDGNKKHLFVSRHSLPPSFALLPRGELKPPYWPLASEVPFWGPWPDCRGPACRGGPWRPAADDPAPRPAAASGSGGRRRDPGTGRRCQPAAALPRTDKEITAQLHA